MKIISKFRPLSRYNFCITRRFLTQMHSQQTGVEDSTGDKQQEKTKTALRKREKTENTSKLKMHGWQIHSYGDVDELQFTDKLKVPQLKQANECLVRVTSTTVNPIDVAMLSNYLKSHKLKYEKFKLYFLDGYGATVLNTLRCQGESIEFPLTLGREFCGILVQKGMNVDIPLGKRVWGVIPVHNTNGAHAEYVAATNHCVIF